RNYGAIEQINLRTYLKFDPGTLQSRAQFFKKLQIDLLEYFVIAVLISIAQGGPLGECTNVNMIYVAGCRTHSIDYIANGMGVAKMTKKHAYQLIPDGKTFRMLVCVSLSYYRFDQTRINHMDNLTKKC